MIPKIIFPSIDFLIISKVKKIITVKFELDCFRPEEVAPLPRQSRSFHELRASVYETIPRALREPTIVR